MLEYKMPSLGADMESGTVVQWHVKPGDAVKRGDIVADVETEKGTIEAEIWTTGTVTELIVHPGQKVPVGTVLALLHTEAGEVSVAASAPMPAPNGPVAASAPMPAPNGPVAASAPMPAPIAPTEKRIRVSPLARKVAAERGVDLSKIQGTGEGGAITMADIETYAAPHAPPVEAPSSTDRMRRAIAQAMSRSKREIPHYYLQTEINMQKALDWLEKFNSTRPLTERVLPIALFVKATAKACVQVPEMNGFWQNDSFHPSEAVHVGIGISMRQGGLVAPAIHETASLSLDAIMKAIMDLVARARTGKLRSSEVSEPTVTVTNLGDQGVETVFGVIYPPQVALLGFGRISQRPWAQGQMVGAAPVVTLTLSADHRASDGHRGAQFLNTIARALQEPEQLEA